MVAELLGEITRRRDHELTDDGAAGAQSMAVARWLRSDPSTRRSGLVQRTILW
jgi:hypothetical protein